MKGTSTHSQLNRSSPCNEEVPHTSQSTLPLNEIVPRNEGSPSMFTYTRRYNVSSSESKFSPKSLTSDSQEKSLIEPIKAEITLHPKKSLPRMEDISYSQLMNDMFEDDADDDINKEDLNTNNQNNQSSESLSTFRCQRTKPIEKRHSSIKSCIDSSSQPKDVLSSRLLDNDDNLINRQHLNVDRQNNLASDEDESSIDENGQHKNISRTPIDGELGGRDNDLSDQSDLEISQHDQNEPREFN